ncbi:3768_t:CDS:2 [Ambispora gerdemannii]|uniref:3768_t:CDS:1 n=1 Tax=Ambispora gerdemannii TaxID=144530 RepID=A0A9N8VTJ5_9GLOM|nr:3768_t:CDS:2 [Ambispora gerdemannii]
MSNHYIDNVAAEASVRGRRWCFTLNNPGEFRPNPENMRNLRDWKMEVRKSRWCQDKYPDAFWKTSDKWWCGYASQVETKGGKVEFVAEKIVYEASQLETKEFDNINFEILIIGF